MMLEYYIINPTGNITALVVSDVKKKHYKIISRLIMQKHRDVEQVGFVDFSENLPKLHMAGGEFCGNATISTAVLYCALNGIKEDEISVSVYGAKEPVFVDVKSENGKFYGTGSFEKAAFIEKRDFTLGNTTYSLPLFALPGIAHIIADNALSRDKAEKMLRKYSKELNYPAMGVMILNREDQSLLPVVYVHECDTLTYENSCVSGSVAVASYLLSENSSVNLQLKQPGGIIRISASNRDPKIKIFGNAIIQKHIKEDFYYER